MANAMERPADDGRSGSSRLHGRRDLALIAATALLLVAIWFDVAPLLRGPAPFPPEWRWPYLEGKPVSLPPGVLIAGAALLAMLAASGSPRARRNPHRAAFAMLLGASLLGPALQLALLEKARPTPVVHTLAHLTMLPGFTGHYSVGVSDLARDPVDFLRRYPELVPVIRKRAPHCATKPPGSPLFYRAVLAACESSPTLSQAALRLAYGPDVADAPRVKRSAERATAVVSPLLLIFLGASACWPIAMLCRAFGSDPLAAARAGVLWTLLPGPTLMIPELDQLIAALVAWTAGLLATALVRAPAWRLRALIAGIAAFAASFLSYGAAAFVCAAAALCAGLCGSDRRQLGRALRVVGLSALGAFAMLGIGVAIGYRPIDAFHASMEIHLGTYMRARSYSTWLLFGPWDLAIFVGLPIALLFAARVGRAAAALARDGARQLRDPVLRGRLGLAVALVALFLSGTLRGEVGRIGMPLMSLCLAAALLPTAATEPDDPHTSNGEPSARFALLLAALLLASCWVLRASWTLP